MVIKLIKETDVFAKLPEDVILHLVPYIDYMDIFCLSEVSNHVKEIFLRIKYREISLSCDFRITGSNFEQVLLNRPSFDSVKQLDLSGIYWLSKERLCRAIFYFKFVERVNVVGTKITDISSIVMRKLRASKILYLTYSIQENVIFDLLRETSSENFIQSMKPSCDFKINMTEHHIICSCPSYGFYEMKNEGIKIKIKNMLKLMVGKAIRWRW